MAKRMSVHRLATRCMKRAWDNETDDDSRKLLERAAKELQRLRKRCLRLAQSCEHNHN